MVYPTVSITCLAYKSLKTIREALRSAWEQDYPGKIEILVREQGEDEEQIATLNRLAEELQETPTRSIVVTTGENLGFAGGHNTLIRKSKSDFVLLLNDDARLMPNYVTRAVQAFSDKHVGAVQGKLLRWDMNDLAQLVHDEDGNPIIDTTGLVLLRNRRIINRGQGMEDRGQFNEMGEIWGADGAAPMYRMKALDSVTIPRYVFRNGSPPEAGAHADSPDTAVGGRHGELLDEDFFAYKEDVDLAWRLNWRGWKTIYVPDAVAWHGRSGGENAALGYRAIIAERRKISPLLKYYSFVNQRCLLIKNENVLRYVQDLPYWFVKEVGAWGYALLFERKTLPAIARIIKLLPTMLKKRRWIMAHRAEGADPYSFFE